MATGCNQSGPCLIGYKGQDVPDSDLTNFPVQLNFADMDMRLASADEQDQRQIFDSIIAKFLKEVPRTAENEKDWHKQLRTYIGLLSISRSNTNSLLVPNRCHYQPALR